MYGADLGAQNMWNGELDLLLYRLTRHQRCRLSEGLLQ